MTDETLNAFEETTEQGKDELLDGIEDPPPPNPFREIVQPFIDFVRSPRALWGVNLAYLLEGLVYFGMLGYLFLYFTKPEYVGLSDTISSNMVGVLTWGITLAMFFLGSRADKLGVRRALLVALGVLIVGRALIAGSSYLGLGQGLWSGTHLVTMGGIFFVIIGYGLFQPAAYMAVRQFTTPKTAAMGYAMLYALMNLGGWLPTFFAPIRRSVGINGAYVVFTGLTVIALILTFFILSRKTVDQALAAAKAQREAEEQGGDKPGKTEEAAAVAKPSGGVVAWLKNHPLADPKFAFFIFSLIPVQTLFAHNWLTLPAYVERAYQGTWIGTNFEVAVNFNPLLIFLLVPIVTALTQKRKVYNMMIWGTLVMAAPTFLLVLGANIYTLAGYLIIMTVGEAMWQPRFLQYAAEIAPEGRTGAYMGVAQFPWFLTKAITPLYAGWFLAKYCPEDGPMNTEFMWFVYGCIAITSTVFLILAKGWLGKDFKTKA